MYVLRRDDGAYVAQPGSERSYTTKLEHARTFSTRAAAEDDRCPGNESVVAVEDLLPRPR
jgi:hypothetical protein